MASLLAIVGPTASGKTALAIETAKRFRGEIICGDSRTIYKGLDIGTAKPTLLERDGIPHYGLDLVEPYEKFSASEFQSFADDKITGIKSRGNLPIIVGGSGLYIDCVLYGYEFGSPADPVLRDELSDMTIDELQIRIVEEGYEMPENSMNKRYLIRTIEQGGINRKKRGLESGTIIIGIDPGIVILEERIRLRAKEMIKHGVLEEVRLIEDDFGWEIPGASGNIYQALRPYIEASHSDLEDCLDDAIKLDLQLARRQRTWFKRNKDIQWFENTESAKIYIASVM